MASLAEKEGLKGKVQMIYMDPPYGIKFGSNWQVSTRKRDVKDGSVADVNREPEVIRAFRDTWKLGIHSYLSYLRDRLIIARELLAEGGGVFVQIGDENVHLVRGVMDEGVRFRTILFPSDLQETTGAGSFSGGTSVLASVNDYLLWYSRDANQVKYRQLFHDKQAGGLGAGSYSAVAGATSDDERFSRGSTFGVGHLRLSKVAGRPIELVWGGCSSPTESTRLATRLDIKGFSMTSLRLRCTTFGATRQLRGLAIPRSM
ncbi:DNA methyltransferase [Candidatus Amarobacter glycogenicus]|uniref:DNA methyltransferase n=1 Tax=Candidatus Amarobacter glycogenicus TaxID=3140699 RepID=UPI0031CC4061